MLSRFRPTPNDALVLTGPVSKADKELHEKRRNANRRHMQRLLRSDREFVLTLEMGNEEIIQSVVLDSVEYQEAKVISANGPLTVVLGDIAEIKHSSHMTSLYDSDERREIQYLAAIERERMALDEDAELEIQRGPLKLTFQPDSHNRPVLTGMYIQSTCENVLGEAGPWHTYLSNDLIVWRKDIDMWTQNEEERKQSAKLARAQELIAKEQARLESINLARETFDMAEQVMIDATAANE